MDLTKTELEALRAAELALKWAHAFLRSEVSRNAEEFGEMDKAHVMELGKRFKNARPIIQEIIQREFPLRPRPRGKIVVNGFMRRFFTNL